MVELSRRHSDEVGGPQYHIEEASTQALVTDTHSSGFKLNINSLKRLFSHPNVWLLVPLEYS